MSVILFIIILAVLVLVHEFGHFIMAKKTGVRVEEFGFGFPPRLFGIKKGETLYSINLIPLGGFVRLYGEEYHMKNVEKNRAFVYKKHWQKTLIITAGIIGNFILAWAIISYLFTQGLPVETNKATIQTVQDGSPAALADLRVEDVVSKISVGSEMYEVKSSVDLITYSRRFAGSPMTLDILRETQPLSMTLTPRKNPPKGQGPLGITVSSVLLKKLPWYRAPFDGFVETATIVHKITVELVRTLGQLITFQKPSLEVSGPIGIARVTGQAAQYGINALLELTALLSLNLAVINIFPFPALDGGRLAFVSYEWITKKRVNKNFERYTNLIGMIFLLSLAVLISINDIAKLSH